MEIASEVHLIDDEDVKRIFTGMKEYCESVIKESEDRFIESETYKANEIPLAKIMEG